MEIPLGYQRVDVPESRSREFAAITEWAFAMTYPEGLAHLANERLDWDRSRGLEVADRDSETAGGLAAIHGSFGYTLRVPGGTVPASGLTWVAVHPAHRRRGLLTSMIADHFARSRSRGEAVSTLEAAETAIYQRFGYGLAAPTYSAQLPRGIAFRDVEGAADLRVTIEDADFARHLPIIEQVTARDTRPGAVVRFPAPMLAAHFQDPEQWREGWERKRFIIVHDDQGPAAFALFQRKLAFEDSQANGRGETDTWAATTAASAHRMWSVLGDLDLMKGFGVAGIALDDPLVTLASDVRELHLRFRDQLWLRILNVPAALEARTYSADVDVTIDVDDSLVAENSHSWRVKVEGGKARVTRTERDAPADMRIGIQDLSAAYLGGVSLDSLAAAGLVSEVVPGPVALLSQAMSSRQSPRSTFMF
jgi:predicted acetyltransferase